MVNFLPEANWICASGEAGSPAPVFRKSFVLEEQIADASLAITALGLYEVEINGIKFSENVLAPGWTDYRKRVPYQLFDVAAHLRPGENVLGVVLGDGWYCGHVAWRGRQFYGDRPRLLASLRGWLKSGARFAVSSDNSWQTATGPIRENDLLMGESYDARLDLGDWALPGYDSRKWAAAIVAHEADIDLTPALIATRRIEYLEPVTATSHDNGNRIFDFGQNFTGRVRFTVAAERGRRLSLRYGEALNPDGTVYLENLRTARAEDRYICGGEGKEEWEPVFTFHGFRHLEVEGLSANDLFEVVAVVLHTDLLPTGSFECSNPQLNQLQHNILWGQKSNFLEVPMDCPQRDERLGWTGDALAFVRTACFNMDVRKFFHKWMQDIRDAQKPEGAVPYIAPDPDLAKNEDGGPAWSDATIICPWTIYLCYGDVKILEDHYASMEKYMAFLAEHRCKSCIRSHPEVDPWRGFGDWLALDGSGNRKGGTPHDLIGTAFYANDAAIMAQISTRLGFLDRAKSYTLLQERIVVEFRERFVGADGCVVSGTQTANVLALRFNLLTPDQAAVAVEGLVKNIRERNYHLATGFVGTPHLLDVLSEHGHLEVAYRLLEQETFPSWLFPVKNGATTIWERWDGWTPEAGFQDKSMNSFNHYAYGAVGAWMYRKVGGIDLDEEEPGYKHIVFRPQPGGSITWAKTRLVTPFGEAAVEWRLHAGGRLSVRMEVPSGCRGTFYPPTGHDSSAMEFGEGSHQVDIQERREKS